MHLPRLYSSSALRTAPLVLVAVCAGCWEKIEYAGPGPSPSKVSRPSADAGATEEPKAIVSVAPSVPDVPAVVTPPVEPAPPVSTPVAAATPPPAPNPTQPKPEEDRYAVPASSGTVAPPVQPASPTPVEPTKSLPAAEASPATRHADATPASATAEAAPPANAIDSRRASWLLGSRLSLAALANDRGIATKNVPVWFGDATKAAKMLGVTVQDLPEPADTKKEPLASKQVLSYLIGSFQSIGKQLSAGRGAEESNLFEMALTSNMLLILYSPGEHLGLSLTETISKTGPPSKLPAELWQPLVDLVNKKAPEADVHAAVRKMHIDVDRYLAERAEPKGQ